MKDESGGTGWKGVDGGGTPEERVGWEPREGWRTERTRSGRRGPQAPQRLGYSNKSVDMDDGDGTRGLPWEILKADDQSICVWNQAGDRSDSAFTFERHTVVRQGVTVWGAICRNTRSLLVVFQRTLTTRSYVDVNRPLVNIVRPVLAWKPLQLSRNPGELTAHLKKLWLDHPPEVIYDLIYSMLHTMLRLV
ncbi:DDE_3 domain-containing protein [Trichonephila clavipes]|nr:DDE_3 domain-containing protein [Trichonephila clavipes]